MTLDQSQRASGQSNCWHGVFQARRMMPCHAVARRCGQTQPCSAHGAQGSANARIMPECAAAINGVLPAALQVTCAVMTQQPAAGGSCSTCQRAAPSPQHKRTTCAPPRRHMATVSASADACMSTAGLYTCPQLGCIHVHSWAVYMSTAGLNTCPQLGCIHVHSWAEYMSTAGLYACPQLGWAHATACRMSTVAGLLSWTQLHPKPGPPACRAPRGTCLCKWAARRPCHHASGSCVLL
jgi:hypothetical protein